ncbi:hypothetical protein QBC38DRAFT_188851 [Podospora fimiseda]|uniref:Uncharacterized protein n=1 Tax=Podospora fimiseda TaxID=252190 RepID=A0AAN6YMM3_9PEZI|nr:hypothetical protein QBC38DRAFT_188851 [Podospora fimiseda]
MTMMPQDGYMFNNTVEANVKYANPGATDQEMHEACGKAGIHETTISRKQGYQTLVGENGRYDKTLELPFTAIY